MVALDKLIVVIEPRDEVARKVVDALTNVGYEVVRTTGAEEAITRIAESSIDFPDLFTFSIGLDGSRITRYTYTTPATKGIPIITRPELLTDLPQVINNALIVASQKQEANLAAGSIKP